MNAGDFLDTNVLVYAYDPTDAVKQQTARALLRRGLAGKAVVSTQVLAEFTATLLHKISPRAEAAAVRAILDALAPVRAIGTDADMVRRAVEAREKYGMHFFDGMIVAAAQRGRCRRILSEDFNPGQEYFGVIAENPFAGSWA